MAAVLVDVANAIVEQLNAADFDWEFTAERSYADWDEKLENLKDIHVDVVPIGVELDLEDRGSHQHLCTVHIGVRRRFEPNALRNKRVPLEEVDSLLLLLEEIYKLLAPKQGTVNDGRLDSFADAAWHEFKPGMWFNRVHLRELKQFTGIVRVVEEVIA